MWNRLIGISSHHGQHGNNHGGNAVGGNGGYDNQNAYEIMLRKNGKYIGRTMQENIDEYQAALKKGFNPAEGLIGAMGVGLSSPTIKYLQDQGQLSRRSQ